MKKSVKYIPIVLFNLLEMFCIFLIGLLLEISHDFILMILLLFILVRMVLKKPLHYKSPYKCFVMTLSIFLTLFVVLKVNLYISIGITIFNAFILTGRANIEDTFLWNGKKSKYQNIIDFVKYNPDKMLPFENQLSQENNLDYLIYKYRFKENMTFQQISELLDIDTPRISEIQDRIALAIRLTYKI